MQREAEHSSLSYGLPSHPLNTQLVDLVAPPTWRNPTPDGPYNLVIIGGGSAGLVAASGAAQLGAKVALIEKHLLGGDCLNVGCVPSKALIRAAKTIGEIRRASRFGIHVPDGVTVDFMQVMEHVWGARTALATHDSAERFHGLGVDVFFGSAEFSGRDRLRIGDQTLKFKKALIATGSRPAVIPIEGLAEAGFLTNETLWNLTAQPRSMAIIGAGPIGAELAQALQRLGTQVTLIDIAPQLLGREDRDAADIVQRSLLADGVTLLLNARTQRVERRADAKVLIVEHNGKTVEVAVDEILLAVGRAPNVEGLNLEAAGVQYTRKGLTVDDTLATTNPNIYGAGDVALKYQFTHTAGHSAALVLQNALFADFIPVVGPKRKFSDLIIPWVTYTDPEVAHVGLYAHDAEANGTAVDTYTSPLSRNDRAVADGVEEGFVKIHVKKGGDKILGATIVAPHAGEIISEITVAMRHDIGLGKLGNVIHPYPTQAEAITKAANEYSKTRLSTPVKGVLNWWLDRTR